MVAALKPLTLAFGDMGPPDRVRLYVERLARYSIDTLRLAVDHLLDTYEKRSFPSIAEVIAACKDRSGITGRLVEQGPAEDYHRHLRRKHDDAAAAAKDYAARFVESGGLAAAARREGWASALYGFVYEAAHVIRQTTAGFPNLGYDANRLLNAAWLNVAEPQRARQLFAARREEILGGLKAQARRGDTEVTVPADLIAEWKRLYRRPPSETA